MPIYLTGMPGSGKTVLGRALADRLNRAFIDLDEEIEKTSGRSISKIFEEDGEAGFRALETEALRGASERIGAVVSTGGGIVLREENWRIMDDTGLVLFIDRPPKLIAKDVNPGHRPLLQGDPNKIFDLYRARETLYRGRCHIMIPNAGDAQSALETLVSVALEHPMRL